jgi:hypothetical protein
MRVPDAMVAVKAKQHIEHYLYQQMSVNPGYFHYDIIRAGLLFEMMDAQAPMNSSQSGKLVNMFAPDAKLPFVASIDVGKAVVAMLKDSDTWGTGQILHAISCICTGKDCAVGLSEASGVHCKYQTMLNPSLWVAGFVPLANYFNAGSGHAFTRQEEWRKEFLEVVPSVMGRESFFSGIGKWSNGIKFGDSVLETQCTPWRGLNKLGRLKAIKIADENVELPVGDVGVPTDYAVIRTT